MRYRNATPTHPILFKNNASSFGAFSPLSSTCFLYLIYKARGKAQA